MKVRDNKEKNKKKKKYKRSKVKKTPPPMAPSRGRLITTRETLNANGFTDCSLPKKWNEITRDDVQHIYSSNDGEHTGLTMSGVGKLHALAEFNVKASSISDGVRVHDWLRRYAEGKYNENDLSQWNKDMRFRHQAAWLLEHEKTHYIIGAEVFCRDTENDLFGQIDVLSVMKKKDKHNNTVLKITDYKGSNWMTNNKQCKWATAYHMQGSGYYHCVYRALSLKCNNNEGINLVFSGGEVEVKTPYDYNRYVDGVEAVKRRGNFVF